MKKILYIVILVLLVFLTLFFSKKFEIPKLPGMVYIPAGEIILGSDEGFPYEGPRQKIFVKPFYIDKTEVTNKQYKRFIDDTGYPAPPHWKNNTYPKYQDNYPVTNVSLDDAEAYAKWEGKRLPTEIEWEKAARSTDGRIYPWGNYWRHGIANISFLFGLGRIKETASTPTDISVYGCYDLAGNVREWTKTKFEPYPGYIGDKKYFNSELYVIRGGSYKLPKNFCFSYRRDALPRTTKLPDLGFRCVKDVK